MLAQKMKRKGCLTSEHLCNNNTMVPWPRSNIVYVFGGAQLLAGGGSADITAQQHHVTALGLQAAGDDLGCARELKRALRLCPWMIQVGCRGPSLVASYIISCDHVFRHAQHTKARQHTT
jgi:hypothetical protein